MSVFSAYLRPRGWILLGWTLILGTTDSLEKLMADKEAQGPEYEFSERISREVLENYLARSATLASLLHFTSEDDFRMMMPAKEFRAFSCNGLVAERCSRSTAGRNPYGL